jgi:hypothetical protein
MKRISEPQRHLNILAKAIENGYELKYQESFEANCEKAEEWLIDNLEYVEEFVKIDGKGMNQQLNWDDRMGYHIGEWGELPSHTFVVDSLANVIKLIHE